MTIGAQNISLMYPDVKDAEEQVEKFLQSLVETPTDEEEKEEEED